MKQQLNKKIAVGYATDSYSLMAIALFINAQT